jgi:hypothetical protein
MLVNYEYLLSCAYFLLNDYLSQGFSALLHDLTYYIDCESKHSDIPFRLLLEEQFKGFIWRTLNIKSGEYDMN